MSKPWTTGRSYAELEKHIATLEAQLAEVAALPEKFLEKQLPPDDPEYLIGENWALGQCASAITAILAKSSK